VLKLGHELVHEELEPRILAWSLQTLRRRLVSEELARGLLA
jgi:hypothetical protein